jgi:2-oxoglutarate ferredoxin oxidoreductase subunit beta
MNRLAEQYIRKEALPLIFCPGCGDGTVLNSFIRTIDEMGIREDLACVSGIGCSSWTPVYLDVDVLHTIHGRAIPFAEGLKVSRPDKKIVVFTGDGDGSGIGGNHLIHAARRNIDLTVVMLTNNIYGMTGGQKAPTTPMGAITKTSPRGNDERPFDVYNLLVGAGATFFARWTAGHPVQLEKALKDAINHKGFSFVEVLSQCPTQAGRSMFNTKDPYKMIQWYKENTYMHKKGDVAKIKEGKMPLGTLYVEDDVVEYTDTLQSIKEEAQCK